MHPPGDSIGNPRTFTETIMAHETLKYIPAGSIKPGDLYTSYGENTVVYEVKDVRPRGKHQVTLTLVDVASRVARARTTTVHLPNDLPVAVESLIPEEPPTPVTFQEKLNANYYYTKLDYDGRPEERTAYRADVSRLNDLFRQDLEADQCDGVLTQPVRDEVYRLAWDRGHSDGHYSVANHYSEYHDLAVLAFKAGKAKK